jgi:hypothetical protein
LSFVFANDAFGVVFVILVQQFVALPSEALRRRFILFLVNASSAAFSRNSKPSVAASSSRPTSGRNGKVCSASSLTTFSSFSLIGEYRTLDGSRDFCHARRPEAVRHAPQRGREKRAQQRK